MNIPGFTAEASINREKKYYSQRIVLAHTNGYVYPQWKEPEDCGVIAGWKQEDRFASCMVQCRSWGGTYSGCYSGCCKQLTGHYCCYIA